jgi:putative phosphoribosyl transferase
MKPYLNREEAGKILAGSLRTYADRHDVLILALPRGGVPIAYEIAKAIRAPLDVFIVRKLGVPNHRELAMGALASGGVTFFNDDIISELAIPPDEINRVVEEEEQELTRREIAYRGQTPTPTIKNKTIILVDDGIATGATMHVAINAIRLQHPASLVVAVPVAAKATCDLLKLSVDQFICPLQPVDFQAVGAWYTQFPQTDDIEVVDLLRDAKQFSR